MKIAIAIQYCQSVGTYQATGFEKILNHQLWHRICQFKGHSLTDQLGFFVSLLPRRNE